MQTENALPDLTSPYQNVLNVLSLPKITHADIEHLNLAERDYLGEISTEKLRHLKGEERDSFIEKITGIVDKNTNDQVWEHNHQVIGRAIAKLISQNGCMPPKFMIARETGLSRQTVARHIATYKSHPQYLAEVEQFKYMTPSVLASVCKQACSGDVKAARLYFEMVGAIEKQQAQTVINEQNNYIQINNTIISQQNLKKLNKEQLDQIERMISGVGES
ncbi:hypothetical protein AAFN85_16770 [Mucilaginibacter sp. CAU 1740]|uniref:hypothetical protein n=1 Tax=Mucilaginibacter sp. CAU 1740 TaxID=3140365 RepID=UPI00325B3D75